MTKHFSLAAACRSLAVRGGGGTSQVVVAGVGCTGSCLELGIAKCLRFISYIIMTNTTIQDITDNSVVERWAADGRKATAETSMKHI